MNGGKPPRVLESGDTIQTMDHMLIKMFLDAVEYTNQEIKFCAVGAHHQNGISESHIKILTLRARTLLLHARRQ